MNRNQAIAAAVITVAALVVTGVLVRPKHPEVEPTKAPAASSVATSTSSGTTSSGATSSGTTSSGATSPSPSKPGTVDPSSVRLDPMPAEIPTVPEAPLPDIAWSPPQHVSTSPAALGPVPELVKTRDRLDQITQKYGLDPENPWAVKHAMLALGSHAKMPDGQLAIDFLFETYAEPVDVHGLALLDFPAKRERPGKTDIRIEPHTDLLLKGLTDVGVLPTRKVTVKGKPYTVGDLYKHSLYEAWVDGDQVNTGAWNDTPWTLQGLAAWAPKDLKWVARGGHPMTMDVYTHSVVTKLHNETQFIRDAIVEGKTVEKGRLDKDGTPIKNGIFGYTCGGAHLLQGAAFAVARGFGTKDDRDSIEDEIPVLFWRYDYEMKLVDDQILIAPQYRVQLLDQRLKFGGHWLETVHRLAAMGLFTPDAGQQATMKKAAADLIATVQGMDELKIWDKLPDIKDKDEQMYLDLVGDATHAEHGIDLATGQGTVIW